MKTLLVALLLLAVGIGPAFAECAWVLWSTTRLMSSSTSSQVFSETILPSDAFKTKNECDEALRGREAREDDRRKRTLVKSGTPPVSPTPWTRVGRRGSKDRVLARAVRQNEALATTALA